MQSKSRIHADPSMYPDDQFDRIPDSLVLLILNKLADIQSLCRCSTVSKRFNSLVPLVHDVHVKIDHTITPYGTIDDNPIATSHKPRNLFSQLLKLMVITLFRPFHHLRNGNNTNRSQLSQVSNHYPTQFLKNFNHIHNLRIEVPSGNVSAEDGVILKWRAEFGSTLQNCVILGGTHIDRKPVTNQELLPEDNGSIPESFYTNGGLKLRVVWTINSLIAASTWHCQLRPIVKDNLNLKSLVLTDVGGHATLSMAEEQLRDFREKPLAASASTERTQVPASNMKLRYAPYLELPEGMGIRGATLVVIKPSNECSGGSKKEAEGFVSGAFGGPFKAAVKALVKRRTYLLEMNSF